MQMTTGFIKYLRVLSENLAERDKRDVYLKCFLLELDCTMLMYGTQLNNLDNMVPGHSERIAFLIDTLQSSSGERNVALIVNPTGVPETSQGMNVTWATDIAESFQELADPNMPSVIGHQGKRLHSPAEAAD